MLYMYNDKRESYISRLIKLIAELLRDRYVLSLSLYLSDLTRVRPKLSSINADALSFPAQHEKI